MWWATLEIGGGGAQRGNLGPSAFFFKGLPFFLSFRNFLKWESAPLITFFRDRKEKSVTVAPQKEISGFPGKSRLFASKDPSLHPSPIISASQPVLSFRSGERHVVAIWGRDGLYDVVSRPAAKGEDKRRKKIIRPQSLLSPEKKSRQHTRRPFKPPPLPRPVLTFGRLRAAYQLLTLPLRRRRP